MPRPSSVPVAQELRVHSTSIPGLLLVDLPVHGDHRGWFKENWQRQKMVAAGLPEVSFVQNNISFNDAVGTTRGIHAEPWDKYVSVATGAVFAAWVDLRAGTDFGTVVTHELTPGRAAFVPRGVGNSFQTLQPGTAYTYLVSDHWSPGAQEHYTFVDAADTELGIAWPIALDRAQRSAQDLAHPPLREVEPVPPAPVLILGAGGQLGRAVVECCRRRAVPYEAHTREQWDLQAPDSWPVESIRGYRAVVNAAAFTAVDDAETPQGRARAWAVNATGVVALTDLCRSSDVPLLHVSTDYVFDGDLPADREYSTEAPVSPLSVYGQSKAAGESAARTWAKHWVVRTSWVIGEGRNFVRTMRELAERGADPQVVADQVGRLSFAEDLATALVTMIERGVPYGTHHCTNSGPAVSWAEVARWVFTETGHDADRVHPVSTRDHFADRPGAPRPLNSRLDTSGLRHLGIELPDARMRLREYLATDGSPMTDGEERQRP